MSLAAPLAAAQGARAFVDLDDRLVSLAPGVIVVRAPAGVAQAIAAHATRRIGGGGMPAVYARPHAAAPLCRELASRLGVADLSCDPSQAATQLLDAASARHAAIVAMLAAHGSWDRSVAGEVARAAQGQLIVFIDSSADGANDVRGDRFEIGAGLDVEERRRWWAAVAEDGSSSSPEANLAELEALWSARKRAQVAAPTEVPAPARVLFTSLALVGRSWPHASIGVLAGSSAAAVRALSAAGAIAIDRGWVALEPAWDALAAAAAHDASKDEHLAIARVLAQGPDFPQPEPWAQARAAELFAAAGAATEADAAYARALAQLDDTTARREVVARWMKAVDLLPLELQLDLRRRAAERALAAGEADEAYKWAKTAGPLVKEGTPEASSVTLLLGRAAVALGDLVTARVALERGRAEAIGGESAATIAVELAEVHYLAGDFERAAREAQTAMDTSMSPSTALRGRNVLGKLLLARGQYQDADRHFAEDAQSAMANGDHTAELRARLNRGIALLSQGLMDEARAIFDGVLAEGERIGEVRACAFALENLAVMATWRQEYAQALAYSERNLKLRQRIGDRLSMAKALTNLAELRLRLGLLDHAEHAIAFARRTLGPGMPIKGVLLEVCAARIACARGNTALARRQIAKAIVDCEAAGEKFNLCQAYCVATRIALEDGDVARAAETLARARELVGTDEMNAEVSYLAGAHARARGASHDELLALGAAALTAARQGGNEDIQREVHVFLAEVHKADAELEAARAHLEHAVGLRDRLAASLPLEIRNAFLAHPGVVAISRVQATLEAASSAHVEDEPRPSRPSGTMRAQAPAREIVGDDPAIRGLRQAIKKVARSNATVLVRGESGTGKELVAEALHAASDRGAGPLVTVNCAALVETLLLSELFGHEKGAFTGAFARRRGRFELAEGGTLFLDEIGDISPRTQVALLRVLQERTFERVGGTTAIRANVRIVCATHRDLKAMVERGEFREDLYYRLRGITLEVPALRHRIGDVPRIADSLLFRIALERGEPPKALGTDALELLGRHRWPGNVRELENALRAASLFAEGAAITAADLADNVDDLRALLIPASAPSIRTPIPTAPEASAIEDEPDTGPLPTSEANATSIAYAQVRQGSVSLSDMKRQIERDCIARALAETKGNITRAAALLGMKRPRLSQLVKQYGLVAVSSEGT